MPRIAISRPAREDLESLPIPLRAAVDQIIADVALDPRGAGYQLVGRLRGTWVARVGNYRVVYTIEGSSAERVVIRAVRHRAIAYRRRPG